MQADLKLLRKKPQRGHSNTPNNGIGQINTCQKLNLSWFFFRVKNLFLTQPEKALAFRPSLDVLYSICVWGNLFNYVRVYYLIIHTLPY